MCQRCEAEYLDYATDQNTLSELLARDPANDPTCSEATDEEWWRFILS